MKIFLKTDDTDTVKNAVHMVNLFVSGAITFAIVCFTAWIFFHFDIEFPEV
jgi:hypothetical protein